MKKIIFLTLALAAFIGVSCVHAQPAAASPPAVTLSTTAAASVGTGVLPPQLSPEAVQSINNLMVLLPVKWWPAIALIIGIIVKLGIVGRIIVGWRNNGLFGVIAGLFGGTNAPANKNSSSGGLSLLAGLLALSLCFGSTANAQTNTVTASTNAPASFWNGLEISGQAVLNLFKADPAAVTQTNWFVVPYGSYEVETKTFGYGMAIVHPLGTYALIGARIENTDGSITAESVNLTLQMPETIYGVTVIPFGVSGTGLESSSLAGYVGGGVSVGIGSWQLTPQLNLTLAAMVDYEHWVNVPSATHVNVGLCCSLRF